MYVIVSYLVRSRVRRVQSAGIIGSFPLGRLGSASRTVACIPASACAFPHQSLKYAGNVAV